MVDKQVLEAAREALGEFFDNFVEEDKVADKLWHRVFQKLPEEVFLIPGYVSAIGSSVTDAEPGDIDVLIRGEPRDFDAEVQVAKALERAGVELPVEFVYNPTGPHGQSIPMYDLKLVRRPEVKTVTPGSEKTKEGEVSLAKQEGERITESSGDLFLTLFDDILKEEGTMDFISESELAERYKVASDLFDDLLGTTDEDLEEAAGAHGEPVEEGGKATALEEAQGLLDDLLGGGRPVTEAEPQEQAMPGKRTVAVPVFKRDSVHGLSVAGYKSVEVEEREPSEEELEALESWDLITDLLGGA